MKRVSVLAVIVLALFSCVTVKAAPSLLPLKSKWTTNAVAYYIQQGANVNERDEEGRTPLMHASKVRGINSLGVMRFLIEAGAHVNAKDMAKYTPLMDAARYTKTPGIMKCYWMPGLTADLNHGKAKRPLIMQRTTLL